MSTTSALLHPTERRGYVGAAPAAVRPAHRWWAEGTKRGFDLVAALVGLVVLLPLLVGIALVVRLADGGPVLFRQTRVGRQGAPFTIYKFRSMVPDAERRIAELLPANEGAAHLFKLRDDPRVTRVGRVLRRLSLDELPQLLNVANGTMSLVGPRPHLTAEVARLSPPARRRSQVRPGITGLWQVSGRAGLSEQQSVRLDLAYVAGCSFALDLAILVRTVGAVLSGRGAS